MSPSQKPRRLFVESMESRQLMAGNVFANVIGGDLVLTGDNASNGVEVRQLGAGVYRVIGQVQGGAPTTIWLGGVAANSHVDKPLIYKIAGAWGNHEGSMLLWCAVSAVFGAVLASTRGAQSARLWSRAVGVQGLVTAGALGWLVATLRRADPGGLPAPLTLASLRFILASSAVLGGAWWLMSNAGYLAGGLALDGGFAGGDGLGRYVEAVHGRSG